MTKKEFATFAMALKTYYPRENLLPNQQAMELWFAQLQDIPYQVAEAGLNKWVSLNKWSPSISDIREMASTITGGELPDWGEAWEEVCRAIRRFGSYQIGEAMDSLSPLTRKATERIGFMNLCMSENQMQDRANFRMIYERLAEREKREAQLPTGVKMLIAKMQSNLIEEKE
jgi:hypothetical protein